MSEVKRYHRDDDEFERYECEFVVDAKGFDRVTAERDALQQRLTASDERADVLTTALNRIQFRCQSFIEGDRAMAVESIEAVLGIAEAALKPAEPAKCNACGGRGSVCVDWDSGAWSDCQECTKP